MPVALADLVLYALLFFAIALAFSARKVTQALLGGIVAFLQKIPVIGGGLAAPFKAVERAVVGACYSIENGCDALIGGAWHRTVELLKLSWREFKNHALVGLKTALYIPLIVAAIHALRALVHKAVGAAGAITPRVKALEKEYHGIEHRVRELEKKIARGIGHDLRIHIKALEKWEKAAQAQLEADAKAITQTIPGLIGNVRDFIGLGSLPANLDWVKGITLAGLAALGLSGLNCDNNPLKGKNCESNVWGDLSQLLGVLATVLAVADFEELVKEMQNAEQGVVSGLNDLLNL